MANLIIAHTDYEHPYHIYDTETKTTACGRKLSYASGMTGTRVPEAEDRCIQCQKRGNFEQVTADWNARIDEADRNYKAKQAEERARAQVRGGVVRATREQVYALLGGVFGADLTFDRQLNEMRILVDGQTVYVTVS